MMSAVQYLAKKGMEPRNHGERLHYASCFVRARENGRKFHTFFKEEIAQLPKNIAKIQLNG